jgi:hypothetical protein
MHRMKRTRQGCLVLLCPGWSTTLCADGSWWTMLFETLPWTVTAGLVSAAAGTPTILASRTTCNAVTATPFTVRGNAGYSFTSTRTTLPHSTSASIPMHRPATRNRLTQPSTTGQTMFVVPNELRNVTHSNHVCVISTAYVHANHNGFCNNGPHCMWEAFCALHPYALNFKRCEIQKWLVDRQINCMHIDPLTGARCSEAREYA